jgi:hypothetical protein
VTRIGLTCCARPIPFERTTHSAYASPHRLALQLYPLICVLIIGLVNKRRRLIT